MKTGLVLVALITLVAGCVGSPARGQGDGELLIHLDGTMKQVEKLSHAHLETTGRGTVVERSSPHGPVFRFPRFDADKPADGAVIVVDSARWQSRDTIVFGADIKLDQESQGAPHDDGDNILQRGLWNDAAQIKLQADRRRPSCGVAGSKARAHVQATARLGRGWYRLRCYVTPDSVKLTVAMLGTPYVAETSSKIKVGALDFDTNVVSIGGKTGPNKRIVESPDQFNGSMRNIVLGSYDPVKGDG